MVNRFIIIIALLVILPAELFSQSETIENLKRDVVFLTSDSLKGRMYGTKYEKRAAEYIEQRFNENFVNLLYKSPGQDFIIRTDNDSLFSQNIVGIVEGWDPKLKNQYIVVGAHYDHLGYFISHINGRDSLQIYRGADDNASGVAVMLEVARMVSAQSFNFRRSVVFVAFGAEEAGMLGSWYFVNRAFSPIDSVSLMVNLDMVGRAVDRESYHAFTVVPNAHLDVLLKDVSDMPLMLTPKIESRDYFPSDHRNFALVGVPTILFTSKIHSDYHSVRDNHDAINYKSMEHLAHYVFNVIKTVANADDILQRTQFAKDKESTDEIVYSQSEVDIRASYMNGGEKEFLTSWVYHYLRYPAKAIEEGIQGRVVVDFIVEKNGEISNVAISRSVNEMLDAEAIRVISVSPKWKPAKIGGKEVRVKISIPVEFRLKR